MEAATTRLVRNLWQNYFNAEHQQQMQQQQQRVAAGAAVDAAQLQQDTIQVRQLQGVI
jgi:hypothetical protein